MVLPVQWCADRGALFDWRCHTRSNVVPDEAAFGILLWIDIIIVAQAFEAVPHKHALAVAFGLVPALAAWGWQLINTALRVSGASLYNVADALREQGLYVHGVIALDRGFLLTSMVWAAVLVFCIERRYLVAAGWSATATILSVTGIMHGYELTPDGAVDVFLVQPGTLTPQIAAPAFAAVHALTTLYLIGLYMFRSPDRPEGVWPRRCSSVGRRVSSAEWQVEHDGGLLLVSFQILPST